MRIGVVSPHLPYDGVPHAGGHFLLRHIEELARHHDVDLYVPWTEEAVRHGDRRPGGISLNVTPLAHGSTTRRLAHAVRRRVRSRSLPLPRLQGLREEALPQLAHGVDVVELHWVDSAIFVRDLRAAGRRGPVVVVAHDVTAQARPALRRLSTPRWERALRVPLDRIRSRREASDLNLADLILVFKEEDEDQLRGMGVRTPTHVVEPSLDVPAGDRRGPGDGTVLFTGAMRRPQNNLGVAWFLREVWPSVVEQEPTAHFVIAGDAPPPDLLELAASTTGVTVTGTVDDLGPFYERAAAFVAPLFVPGGVKFKVPQAMVYDLPVIATPVALEGFGGPPDLLWRITDDPGEMAATVVEVLRSPATSAAHGRRAGEWVRTQYSFERSTQRVLARYEVMCTAATSP